MARRGYKGQRCGTCCGTTCLIDKDLFEETLAKWTVVGTWEVADGLLVGTGAGGATFNTPVPSAEGLRIYTYPLKVSADGTLRLMVCKSDDNNFLWGKIAIVAGVGTITLGERVNGTDSDLTEAVTLDDTGAELNERFRACLSFDPGDLQPSKSYVFGGILPRSASGNGGGAPQNNWLNPENITAIDEAPASWQFDGGPNATTADLLASAFPVSVPPGSIIDGVGVGARCRVLAHDIYAPVTLTKMVLASGAATSDNRAANQVIESDWEDVGDGGPTDGWGLNLTWETVRDLSVSIAFAVDADHPTLPADPTLDVDAIWVDIYFTTPEKIPGRLRLSYRNTGAPQNTQCVTEYSAETQGGRRTGLQIVDGDFNFTEYHLEYLQSDSRPECGVCDCTDGEADGEPCECCDPEFPPAASYVLDFGAGGWMGTCTACAAVSGSYVVDAAADCNWLYGETGTCDTSDCNATLSSDDYLINISLSLINDGEGSCYWRAAAGIATSPIQDPSNPDPQCHRTAIYESALLTTNQDCRTVPVTLTKVAEFGSLCIGNLPATIPLEAA
jgi:hypothetical protein